MESIRQYILSVTAAAVICGIISALLGKKGTTGAIGKLLSGIFLAMVILRPLGKISLSDLTEFTDSYAFQANCIAQEGESLANEALADIIKERTQAYILDKADALGVSVSVEVQLSRGTPQLPETVTVRGAVPPYQRRQLMDVLENDLGIPEEKQIWIS